MASSNWKHSVFLEKGSLLTPQVGSNFPISRQVFFPIVGNLSFSCFSLSVCNVNEKLFIQKDQKETFTLPGCFLTDFFSNTSESLQVFLVNQMTQKFCLLFSLPVASHHIICPSSLSSRAYWLHHRMVCPLQKRFGSVELKLLQLFSGVWKSLNSHYQPILLCTNSR